MSTTQAPLLSATTTTVLASDAQCASVLLLGDNLPISVEGNEVLARYIRASNMSVRVIHGGLQNFTGTPDPKLFDVVILIPAIWYIDDMPESEQTAILDAHRSGTNIVITEWSAYQTFAYGKRQILKTTHLLGWDKQQYICLAARAVLLTFTCLIDGHPIWYGLPKTFRTTIPMGSTSPFTLVNNATLIAEVAEAAGIGVAIRDSVAGEGRIVQINHSAHAHGSPWDVDQNIRPLMINSIKWAAKCI